MTKVVKKNIIKALVAGIIAFGILIGLSDLRKLIETAANVDLRWSLAAVAGAFASFTIVGLALVLIFRAFGAAVGSWHLLKVSFVSTVINQTFSTGGISGYAVRAYLLSKKGVSYATSLIASVVYNYLLAFALFLLFVGGFVYLLAKENLKGPQALLILGEAVLFAFLLSLTLAFLLSKRFRIGTIDVVTSFIDRMHRKGSGENYFSPSAVDEFTVDINLASRALTTRKLHFLPPFALLLADWAFVLVTLYLSFRATGYHIEPAILIAGFSVGFFVSTLSFIPAGFGILEGTLAGFFHFLGVPLETALVAVMLFRVVYFFIPFLSCSVLFGRLVRQALRERTGDTGERLTKRAS